MGNALSQTNANMIDWLKVFEVFLGAFSGFLFGMLSSYISKLIGIRGLKSKIRLELQSKIDFLNNQENFNAIGAVKFHSPVWDMAIDSGFLFSINNKSYERIIRLYSKINVYLESEKKFAEMYKKDEVNLEDYKKNIKEIRQNILDCIKTNLI